MVRIEDLFLMGMKRELPHLLNPLPGKPVLNLGGGNTEISGAYNLDLPDWNAELDAIPYDAEEIGGIFAFHFLEHLWEPRRVLRECERVLAVGAPMTIVVPHAHAEISAQDIDHKKMFVIDTWPNLMDHTYYNKQKNWRFKVGLNMTMAIQERNTSIFTQLIKTERSS